MLSIGRFIVLFISSLIIVSCVGPISDVTLMESINYRANESTKPTIPTNTPRPTQTPARYIIPKHSYNIEEDGDALYFENGAPIPALATFYKNQLLAQKCALQSESGSNLEAIVMVFSNCENFSSLRIIIYANPTNNGSVITIAPKD